MLLPLISHISFLFSHSSLSSSSGKLAAYSCNAALSSTLIAVLRAYSSTFECSALSQWDRVLHRYAPRPDFLPDSSTTTCPSGSRTRRTRPLFGPVVLQATQVRCGTGFGLGPLTAFAISNISLGGVSRRVGTPHPPSGKYPCTPLKLAPPPPPLPLPLVRLT